MTATETWFVHARLDEEVGTLVMADVPGKDHDIIADCVDGGGVDHDTAERRARLIAAAPDLLKALKHCVIERSEWLDEARAAIAKAEGSR